MCEVCKNANIAKKIIKKEQKSIEYDRQLKLIKELGEPAEKFNIIDEKMMTIELIKEFDLAIKSGVAGRPPKKNRVIKNPTVGDKYEIRWRYDLRLGIDGPKVLPGGRTREFCVDVLSANRYYTKEDINSLSNGFGLSVFEYAGGWYTNPDTGETTPYCRHSWYMIFVERK